MKAMDDRRRFMTYLAALPLSSALFRDALWARVLAQESPRITRDMLVHAAAVAGESVCRLPLWPDLERFLTSDVADVRNIADTPRADPGAGAITAALFLKRFVGDTPWAHLDIAGPAYLPTELATHYLPPGGTGFGVRTLLAWLERRA